MGDGLIAAHIAARGLKVWDTIRDNDPRMPNRTLIIDGFGADGSCIYALCNSGARKVRVRLDRIHTDGKPRRSGFSLIQP